MIDLEAVLACCVDATVCVGVMCMHNCIDCSRHSCWFSTCQVPHPGCTSRRLGHPKFVAVSCTASNGLAGMLIYVHSVVLAFSSR
jgi:hypothetical protein